MVDLTADVPRNGHIIRQIFAKDIIPGVDAKFEVRIDDAQAKTLTEIMVKRSDLQVHWAGSHSVASPDLVKMDMVKKLLEFPDIDTGAVNRAGWKNN